MRRVLSTPEGACKNGRWFPLPGMHEAPWSTRFTQAGEEVRDGLGEMGGDLEHTRVFTPLSRERTEDRLLPSVIPGSVLGTGESREVPRV